MSRQRRSRYVPKRNSKKTKGISKKMLSTGAIIFVVLLGLSVLFGGGDTSDSETDIVAPPAAASVDAPAQASDPADTATVPPENQSAEVASAEPAPVETIPAEQPAEVPAEVPEPVTEAPAEEVPQAVDTPVVSDPVPVPVEAPAAAPDTGSGGIYIADGNYTPETYEPDTTRAIPDPAVASGEYVYISETGSKYHNNPNCSNMNYTLVSLEEALAMGREPCKKCYD